MLDSMILVSGARGPLEILAAEDAGVMEILELRDLFLNLLHGWNTA